MTLVIVNRVARAQALYAAIGKRLEGKGETTPEVVLVHARFRSRDRQREMDKILVNVKKNGEISKDLIVVSTQAVEAGVDVSAAVLFTELAPWASVVQRFGRANRYAELEDGADVRWIDLLDGQEDDKDTIELALPYAIEDMKTARQHLLRLNDVAPAVLPAPGDVDPPRRVIRRKDLDDLFDTDPDLMGFDVDVSSYIRDAADTDVHVFWRDLSSIGDNPPRPRAEELCAVPIGAAGDWLKKLRKREKGNAPVFVRDPQWRRGDTRTGVAPPGWTRFRENPWPGLTLLVDIAAGGYREAFGFTGDPADTRFRLRLPTSVKPRQPASRQRCNLMQAAKRKDTTKIHAAKSAFQCSFLPISGTLPRRRKRYAERSMLIPRFMQQSCERPAGMTLARRTTFFQNTMRRGLEPDGCSHDHLLAKTIGKGLRHERRYFRHELASALAFLAHEKWSREADLVAYLVAAHHGKVRMNLRALPRETAPPDENRTGARFARGVWEDDELPPFDLTGGERWEGGGLTLSVMELGWDEVTRESWTERTRNLLARYGPFRLAWMETLVRIADWRASNKEQEKRYDDI